LEKLEFAMTLPSSKIKLYNTARARLFLLVLLVVVPALGVQVYGAWSDLQQTLNERKLESVRVVDRAQGDFNQLLTEAHTVFTDLVRLNDIRSSNNCTQVFTALRFAYERLAPDAVNLALADAQGNIYCAINPVQGDRNIASQSDFQAALQTLDLSIGAYRLNPSTGLPFVSVSYPALSLDGKVQTVIVATFETHWLEIWQSEISLPAGASVTLFAPDGTALRRTVSGEKVPVNGLAISKSDWFGPLQAGNTIVESPDFDGGVRLHTITRLGDSAILHLGYPVSELYAQAYDNLRWKLALLGLVVLFAFGVAWWVSETMFLHPLNNLLEVVRRVQDGDLSARISGLRGLGELTALAYSFDKMTETLQQREAERQQSEGRFRAMFENAAVGISIISPEGKTLAVNPTLVKLSGRAEAELIEIGGRGVTYPEDQNVGMAEFHEILEGKRNDFQVEKRYVHKDGRIHWMRQSVSAVRDEAGKAQYMIVIAEDIEERKRALEELRESEARFRAMFESSAIGMGLGEINGNMLAANTALCKMSGYTEEELKQRNDSQNSHPEDAQVGMDLFAEMMAGKRDFYSVEKRYVRKNGEVFWTRLTLSLVRDSEGKPSYLVNMIEDIDEQKRKSEELRESEARFRAMYDNAAVGVAVMTLDRRIVQVNQTAERMTGYSQEEIGHIDPTILVIEEDRIMDRQNFVELVEGKREQYTVEKRYIRKNGDIFWGRVNFSLVRGADGNPLYTIGMIEDITEEKRAAEKLAAQEADHRRQLEQRITERTEELNLANERLREKAAQDAVTAERTRLARDLHDAVTQTLFSTTLIADVLPDIWEMNPDEGKRRLEELRLLTRGALAEMRTLLVELRPNALVEVPLPTLLRQLTEALSGRARINIQLSAEGERKLPADVQISLYRIAQEALNNVFKHAKANQAIVTLRMGDTVRLTIADNGTGFDPSTVTADHLGVKIMRERADAIGAKLSIYSEPGEGTQISVVWS
jgi:PAS domain S-box-containing protein